MMKHFVTQAIEEKKDLIVNVSDQIFDFAEVGFHEFKTADLYEKVLKEEGFQVPGLTGALRAPPTPPRPLAGTPRRPKADPRRTPERCRTGRRLHRA